MTVLVADDSDLVRKNFLKLFQTLDLDLHIVESEDVPRTMEKLMTVRPDVLFLDLQMPGGSGFDVLEFLRYEYTQPKPLVIVFSNYTTEQNRRKCLNLGADECFDKSTEYLSAIGKLQDFYAHGGGVRRPPEKLHGDGK